MNYDASNFRKKKYVNKERLQEELGLEVDKKKYMIGLISRLTDQKGLDLINAVMDGLVDEFTQLVVIGTGFLQISVTLMIWHTSFMRQRMRS